MKTISTILLTFSFTVGAVAFAASLFLNSLLGVFGLTATSIGAMQKLQASSQIVEKLRERHNNKRLKVSKRFAKAVAAALNKATNYVAQKWDTVQANCLCKMAILQIVY